MHHTAIIFMIGLFAMLVILNWLMPGNLNDRLMPYQFLIILMAVLSFTALIMLMASSNYKKESNNWFNEKDLKPGSVFNVVSKFDSGNKDEDNNYYILQEDRAELDRKMYPYRTDIKTFQIGDRLLKDSHGNIIKVSKEGRRTVEM
ncbi:MAG TPA: hypothetical protein VKO61_00165 [Candidatus Paceibacterota bacterium]|nr:hypothetical protein [Candidatus Paceibacterota bacterium]